MRKKVHATVNGMRIVVYKGGGPMLSTRLDGDEAEKYFYQAVLGKDGEERAILNTHFT